MVKAIRLHMLNFFNLEGVMIIKVFSNSQGEDIFRLGLNTELATSHDYIAFARDVLDLCGTDINSLEKEADELGRTIKHRLVDSVGSIPKGP